MVKAMNTQAIEAGTATSWEDWCSYLDGCGAAKLEHNAIVKKTMEFRPVSSWWAQGVAVAYEQHIGRRKPGQKSDGRFSISVSRTVGDTLEATFETWNSFAADLTAIGGQAILLPSTTSITPKRHYWRCKFEDGSAAVIGMETKPNGKVLVALEHSKLDGEIGLTEKKQAWSRLFTDCFGL